VTAPTPFPLPAAAVASAGMTLAAQFPHWQITTSPDGMWVGYWQSADGRHRRCVVAPSAPRLLAALREISTST
jgi:hypothetical protein